MSQLNGDLPGIHCFDLVRQDIGKKSILKTNLDSDVPPGEVRSFKGAMAVAGCGAVATGWEFVMVKDWGCPAGGKL